VVTKIEFIIANAEESLGNIYENNGMNIKTGKTPVNT
jgi:hypothetical protein